MREYQKIIALLLAVCLLAGCAAPLVPSQSHSIPGSLASSATSWATQPTSTAPTASEPTLPQQTVPAQKTKAQLLLEEMSLEEKVAQLFLVAMAEDVYMQWLLQRYSVGGVIFFANNIKDPAQLRASMEALRENAKYPLLLAIDEEGGRVARLGNDKDFDVPKVGSAQSVGRTGDPENAWKMGSTIGAYLKEYDFDLNFAPVADVNTNPKNTVIGDRAFGSDPQLVAKMVSAAVEGLQSQGVMACIKHFPGHGDTQMDSHYGAVSVQKTWQELMDCELISFMAALDKTDMVMVAHINTPNITKDGLPCSVSREMITERLRKELGYEGLVITDSLAMGAITQRFSPEEAAVLAIQAGVDILLIPEDFIRAYEGILEAVADGRISQQRIEESVLRILTLKEKYGMLG